MPFGDLGRLPYPSSSTSTTTSDSPTSTTSSSQQTLYRQTRAAPLRWGWIVSLSAAVVHPSVFPLISFASTADLLHFCLLLSISSSTTTTTTNTATMPPILRVPMSPIKASVVRHEEHCKGKDHCAALDPDCPICQVPIGKKSPEGVKEGYSVLSCGHVFGSICIKTYLAITDKPQCPICRTNQFHHCSHPVHPMPFDHRKVRLSPAETAAKAFPTELSTVDCKYCRTRALALFKKRRRRQLMDAARSATGCSSSSSTGTAAAAAAAAEGSEQSVGGKATRKLKTLPHEDIDSEQSSGGGSGSNGSDSSEHDDDDDEGPDSPASPSQGASRSDLPPVPGQYGHWDLANKDRDWKFLSWYNDQDPKINLPSEHFV